MEQKDYILREIEKIGVLLRLIFNKLARKEGGIGAPIEYQFEDVKSLLLEEIGFDLDLFLSLKDSEIEQYLYKFNGFKDANLELFADVLKEFGLNSDTEQAKKSLASALKIYELCNSKDKTFSFEREEKIQEIKKAFNL
jgi:hypothetical protein